MYFIIFTIAIIACVHATPKTPKGDPILMLSISYRISDLICNNADVVIAIDASESIEEEQFEQVTHDIIPTLRKFRSNNT
jgi:hypothetical protein